MSLLTNYLNQHKKQAKNGFSILMANPLGNMLTLIVIALSLAIPVTFYVIAFNISVVAEHWHNPTQLTVYLKKEIGTKQGEAIAQSLIKWTDINNARYISPKQGLDELNQIAGFQEAVATLDQNPLPGVIVIEPTTNAEPKARIDSLVTQLKQEPHVDNVRVDSLWLQRFIAIKALISTCALLVSLLMLFAVFLMVGNTLRLQLLNNKEEIQVMKLVGATDRYILRPYLYLGFWYGFLGALIAWILSCLVLLILNHAVLQLAALYQSSFKLTFLGWDEVLLLIMLSCVVSFIAARLSTRQHLKEIEPV